MRKFLKKFSTSGAFFEHIPFDDRFRLIREPEVPVQPTPSVAPPVALQLPSQPAIPEQEAPSYINLNGFGNRTQGQSETQEQ